MKAVLLQQMDDDKGSSADKEEKIAHTGSGGAFDKTEQLSGDTHRDISDEQLDERLEDDTKEKDKQQRAY